MYLSREIWIEEIKCPLAKVRGQFSELVKEKRRGLARGDPCFCLFLGNRNQVFLDRRVSCRVA